MRKLIIFISVFLFASINSNLDDNLRVIRSLDIEDSFLNNPKLKSSYSFYYRHRNRYFINSLENGVEIYPIIKSSIEHSPLPKELVSVVMAESLMKINAMSNKKAIGIWQFIPSTAKRFGLKIDDYVDERKDIYKSTKAAIKYLSYLHDFFGKWYLAIMAYNAGEARIVEGVVRAKVDKICEKLGKERCRRDKRIRKYRQIIRAYQKYGSRKFYDLYKLYLKLKLVDITLNDLMRYQKNLSRQYIPKETRFYMLKILSLSFLFNNNSLREFSQKQLLKGLEKSTYVSVKVPAGTSLFYVANILEMNYKDIRKHNLHLKYSFTPPYDYYIYVPANRIELFYSRFNPKNRKYVYIYRVKKGDTLRDIAKKFGVKLKLLYAYNKFGKYLHIGEKILIPLDKKFIKYKVKKGDTLGKIARQFGISYKKIMELNDLDSSVIRVGEVLKVPQNF